MGVRGDFDELSRMRQTLIDLSLAKGLLQKVEVRMRQLVNESFDTETDPYGRPWERRRGRGAFFENRKLLYRTGELKNTISVRMGPGRSVIVEYAQHGVYHQSPLPRKVIPRRMFVPEDHELSPHWAEEIEDVASDWFEEKIREAKR